MKLLCTLWWVSPVPRNSVVYMIPDPYNKTLDTVGGVFPTVSVSIYYVSEPYFRLGLLSFIRESTLLRSW